MPARLKFATPCKIDNSQIRVYGIDSETTVDYCTSVHAYFGNVKVCNNKRVLCSAATIPLCLYAEIFNKEFLGNIIDARHRSLKNLELIAESKIPKNVKNCFLRSVKNGLLLKDMFGGEYNIKESYGLSTPTALAWALEEFYREKIIAFEFESLLRIDELDKLIVESGIFRETPINFKKWLSEVEIEFFLGISLEKNGKKIKDIVNAVFMKNWDSLPANATSSNPNPVPGESTCNRSYRSGTTITTGRAKLTEERRLPEIRREIFMEASSKHDARCFEIVESRDSGVSVDGDIHLTTPSRRALLTAAQHSVCLILASCILFQIGL